MGEFDNSTRTPVIRVGTTEAVQSVKDLRDNIKDLRDEIVALSNSEKKDADTAKQLAQAEQNLIKSQQELNRVMGLTKSGADGVEGSYNKLKAELRETKQAMDAIPKLVNGQLNPAWDALAERYKELNKQAKAYDYELGNFQRNVGNYGNAWQSIGQSMGNVKQVGGDMVNGLSAAASTMSMLGLATDGLNDSMNNFRIVLGVVQGMKGIAGMVKGLTSFVRGQKNATNATKADTVAQKAETAALEGTATAETHASVAGTILKGVLMSLGIGLITAAIAALVNNLESVAKWFEDVADAIFHFKKEEDKAAESSDNLLDKLKKKNNEFDREIRILEAQGTSRMKILEMQRDNIRETLKEIRLQKTQAELRISQLKADHKWWKFWENVNGKIKKEQEKIDEWTEEIKNLEEELANKKVDIVVEGITSRNAAAKKAAEDARKAEAEYQKAVSDSEKKITDLQKTHLSEYEKIKEEEKEVLHTVNDVYLKELETLRKKKQTQEVVAKIAELEAKIKENVEIVDRYYQKTKYNTLALSEFNEKTAVAVGKIAYESEQIDKTSTRRRHLLQDILGYTDQQLVFTKDVTTQTTEELLALEKKLFLYNDIAKVFKEIKGLEPSDLGLSGATFDDYVKGFRSLYDMVMEVSKGKYNLNEAYMLSIKNPVEFAKMFTEPLATAIIEYNKIEEEWLKKSYERDDNMLKEHLDQINNFVDSGEYREALKKIYFLDSPTMESLYADVIPEMKEYFQKVRKEIYQGIMDSENPLEAVMGGVSWHDVFDTLYNQPVEAAKQELATLRDMLASVVKDVESSEEEFLELEMKIDWAEKKLHDARMKRLEAWNKQANKYLSTYGAATSNMLSSVADAWEESLRSQENVNESAFDGVKALQYSTAVINTAAAVVQALADPTVPSYYVKIANAAAAVAAGTAQVIKIANTKYGTDSQNSAPSLVDRTPQLQYTYGINPNDYAQAAAQNPVRAYVVDKDLVDGIENYNAVQDETTF